MVRRFQKKLTILENLSFSNSLAVLLKMKLQIILQQNSEIVLKTTLKNKLGEYIGLQWAVLDASRCFLELIFLLSDYLIYV